MNIKNLRLTEDEVLRAITPNHFGDQTVPLAPFEEIANAQLAKALWGIVDDFDQTPIRHIKDKVFLLESKVVEAGIERPD